MTIGQVKDFFFDKENTPCPLTDKLVKTGYQQRSGGYIDTAKKEGILVDYTQNSPTQYWHLMTYCDSRDTAKPFLKSIVCGELIFWMAEVSESVPASELEVLVNEVISNTHIRESGRPCSDRNCWNKKIQELCFDRIVENVNSNNKRNERIICH